MEGWDGTLTAKEFKEASLYLSYVWETYCSDSPPWHWQSFPVSPFMACDTPEGYLVLEDVFVEDAQSEESPCYDSEQESKDSGAVDLATAPPLITKGRFFNYHVIYSEVFRVPKLFLNGRFPDGRPLQWQDIQQTLPAGVGDERTKWTFLTYEEHPYLRLPWLALHPCGTSHLMSTVFSQDVVEHSSLIASVLANSSFKSAVISETDDGKWHERLADKHSASVPIMSCYILTWLSFVSQAVAFKLPRGFMNCFTNINDKNTEKAASEKCSLASFV